tara:strand:- start:1558 stop:1734 length:177 start_codon:yes stop_codon:yes gene_type:complete
MNKSKKTQAQIEREMKSELRKQGIDVDFQDDFGDVYGNDDDVITYKDNYDEYGDGDDY